jgi:arsenite methyltransferase
LNHFEKDNPMSKSQSIPNILDATLRGAIKKEYENVAIYPNKGYHFHTGREAANRIGYDKTLYDAVPEKNIASFAGTGNPFNLGPINPGDMVVDVGSGSGFDSLIASKMVGPKGRVVGIDMTHAMLRKARFGAKEMGAINVEFREGHAENLPLPDEFADVIISNGVLNLTLDKKKTLSEWERVLKPGGRLYIGDILVAKSMPQSALEDISLWTG